RSVGVIRRRGDELLERRPCLGRAARLDLRLGEAEPRGLGQRILGIALAQQRRALEGDRPDGRRGRTGADALESVWRDLRRWVIGGEPPGQRERAEPVLVLDGD